MRNTKYSNKVVKWVHHWLVDLVSEKVAYLPLDWLWHWRWKWRHVACPWVTHFLVVGSHWSVNYHRLQHGIRAMIGRDYFPVTLMSCSSTHMLPLTSFYCQVLQVEYLSIEFYSIPSVLLFSFYSYYESPCSDWWFFNFKMVSLFICLPKRLVSFAAGSSSCICKSKLCLLHGYSHYLISKWLLFSCFNHDMWTKFLFFI